MNTPICRHCSKRVNDEMPSACYTRPLCLDEPDTFDDEEQPAGAYDNNGEKYV